MRIADILEGWISDAEILGKKTALIEGLQKDESFWRDLFLFYTKGQVKLDFPLAPKTGRTGKSSLTEYYDLLPSFPSRFVICRDSDNEHLYDSSKEALFAQPYLYHTYTYNLENHKCVASNLTKICEEITSKVFDFENNFFAQFNAITYRFLMIGVWLKKQEIDWTNICKANRTLGFDVSVEKQHIFALQELYNETVIREVLKYDKHILLKEYWTLLQQKVADFEANVKSKLIREGLVGNISDIDRQISQITTNFSPTIPIATQHFYFNGHILLDSVIKPILEKQRDELIQQKYTELSIVSGHLAAEYKNKAYQMNIFTLLDTSYQKCFMQPDTCDFIQRIGDDIQRDFSITS